MANYWSGSVIFSFKGLTPKANVWFFKFSFLKLGHDVTVFCCLMLISHHFRQLYKELLNKFFNKSAYRWRSGQRSYWRAPSSYVAVQDPNKYWIAASTQWSSSILELGPCNVVLPRCFSSSFVTLQFGYSESASYDSTF